LKQNFDRCAIEQFSVQHNQGDLAAELKVSRQTVNALETERYEPSLSLAFSIAKLFEQPIEAMF
jgi:putative transcriptional regulator